MDFDQSSGFTYSRQSEGAVVINAEHVSQGVLRNGDTIELGAVRLRFWLAPSRQKQMKLREGLTWGALLSLFALQAALVCVLLR